MPRPQLPTNNYNYNLNSSTTSTSTSTSTTCASNYSPHLSPRIRVPLQVRLGSAAGQCSAHVSDDDNAHITFHSKIVTSNDSTAANTKITSQSPRSNTHTQQKQSRGMGVLWCDQSFCIEGVKN
eukprot:gene8737-1120_t